MYQFYLSVISEIAIDKFSRKPIYLQISVGLINIIRSGRIQRGVKLPGSRKISNVLGIHRRTLQMALDELYAQGWIEIIPRKGTYVTKDLPELKPASTTLVQPVSRYPQKTDFVIRKTELPAFPQSDFQMNGKLILAEGFPDIRLAPMRELSREWRSLEKRGVFKKYLHYGDPQGTLYLREILGTYLAETRSLPVSTDNIMITRGAQMGLFIASRLLINCGDRVVVGDPGYVTATLTLQRAGATIHRVEVDKEGISIDQIEELCMHTKIRAVYIISHHHHPTTVTLTPERRIRLLNLATEYKFAIIEDDYDYDFHYSSGPVLPMASLDQMGNVIYIGTLSKTLVPAVRTGFLVAPMNFIKEAVSIRRSIDLQGDSILEIAISELFRNGILAGHIKKAVRIYRERRDNFNKLIREKLSNYISYRIPDGGLAIWAHFKNADLVKIASNAAKKGLIMYDGRIYNTKNSSNTTRLGFSSLNFNEQERAVNILQECIEEILDSKTGI